MTMAVLQKERCWDSKACRKKAAVATQKADLTKCWGGKRVVCSIVVYNVVVAGVNLDWLRQHRRF